MVEYLRPEDIESFREKACYKVNNGHTIHTKNCNCKDKPYIEYDDEEDDPCYTCDSDIGCADCEFGGN